jgi:hypothetical protein
MVEKEQSKIHVISTYESKEILNLMLSRGLDRLVLQSAKNNFILDDAVQPFKPSVAETKARAVGEVKQISDMHKLIDNPLKRKGVSVINAFPTDLRSKMLAANIMYYATEDYKNMTAKERRGKSAPMWIRLLGGFSQDLQKIKAENPCMIILSNVSEQSSSSKLEKLRDCLDMFDDIPRIVVTAGIDPLTFMMKHVYYPVSSSIRIGSAAKINSLMDI